MPLNAPSVPHPTLVSFGNIEMYFSVTLLQLHIYLDQFQLSKYSALGKRQLSRQEFFNTNVIA